MGPDDKIEGYLFIKKTKLEQGKLQMLQNLPNMTTITNLVGQRKSFCCIRNGVLYQYDRKTARENTDRFKLGQVTALDLKTEGEKEYQIRMIYKKYYVILTFDDLGDAQKWLASLQYVRENYEQYVYNQAVNKSRYRKLKVFERVTGKSIFVDYDVLLEQYEIKEMQTIWIKSHIYMLRKSNTQGFEHDQTDAAMEKNFKDMVNNGVKNDRSKTKLPPKTTATPIVTSAGGKTFKLDQRESTKDLQARHNYMKSMRETKDLMFKMNPGELDLYEAAFGQDGVMGELVVLIDSKVRGILNNRIRMSLLPFEEQKAELELRDGKGRVQMARKSKFIKQAQIDLSEIINEEYGLESSYDSESYYSDDATSEITSQITNQ